MTAKALWITTAGELVELEDISLNALQEAVGGWVQAIGLKDNLTMWLNEEGKLHGLEHNSSAQRLFDRSFGAGYDLIVGDAVLMGGADEEGDTLGLTEEQVALYTYALSAE